jgi:hypothetical protein
MKAQHRFSFAVWGQKRLIRQTSILGCKKEKTKANQQNVALLGKRGPVSKYGSERLKHYGALFTISLSMQRQNSTGAVRRLRGRYLPALLIIPLIAFAAVGIAPASQSGKPLPFFAIDKTEHNFGEVFVGEDISCVFNIRNQGSAPLELAENPIIIERPKAGRYQNPTAPGIGLNDRLVYVGSNASSRSAVAAPT